MISIIRPVMPVYPELEAFCGGVLLQAVPSGSQIVEIRQSAGIEASLALNTIPNYLSALNRCDHETVYMCDYDCLYHRSYFQRQLVCGAVNYVSTGGFFLLGDYNGVTCYIERRRSCTACMAGDRDMLREAFHRKWEAVVRKAGRWRAEPGPEEGMRVAFQTLELPWVDIRHQRNATRGPRKRGPVQIQELLHWGKAVDLWRLATGGGW